MLQKDKAANTNLSMTIIEKLKIIIYSVFADSDYIINSFFMVFL